MREAITMKHYVDGYILPIPKKNIKEYKKMAQAAGEIWMKHGALQYVEAVGNDLNHKWGAKFPKTLKTKTNETVVFAFVVFTSKTHRNSVNAKVMKDPLMCAAWKDKPMPFDMKRMVYGGFSTLVNL